MIRCITLLLTVLPFFALAQNPTEILNQSIAAIEAAQGYRFEIKSYERVDGEMTYTRVSAKMMASPFKMYAYSHEKPHSGSEVLYATGERSNKALINPGKFLPNLKMDPFGNMMRKGQHHTIFNTGFDFIQAVMTQMLARGASIQLAGDVTFANRSCYKIVIDNPSFAYIDHTLSGKQSLFELYQQKTISEYLMVEANSNIKSYDDAPAGSTIKIPNSYAKKVILYIDKANLHPIYQEFHDDKGKFEQYEFSSLEVNPDFASDEFSDEFKGYNF